MYQKEPLWKRFLCWGVVITYLTFPLIVFIAHLTVSPELYERLINSEGLRDFFVSITSLAVSLAGLNTWHMIKSSSNGKDTSKNKQTD